MIGAHIEVILIVTRALTAIALLQFIAPAPILRMIFGATDEIGLAVARHWGLLFFDRGAAHLCSISSFGSGPRDGCRCDRESGARPRCIRHILAHASCRSGDRCRRFPHCAHLCPPSGGFLGPMLALGVKRTSSAQWMSHTFEISHKICELSCAATRQTRFGPPPAAPLSRAKFAVTRPVCAGKSDGPEQRMSCDGWCEAITRGPGSLQAGQHSSNRHC